MIHELEIKNDYRSFKTSVNPCILGAIISGGLGLISSLIGSKGTKRAAQTQADAATRASEAQLQLGREQLESTQPLRDLALQQAQFQFGQQKDLLPLLRQEFESGAGLSPFFQQQLQRGTQGTISSLAPFGLEDSSVAGRAIGELGAGLGTQELLARRNLGLSLAGLTPSFFGGAQAGLGTAAQLGQAGIQTQLQGQQGIAAGQLGQARTQADFFSGLGGLFQGQDFSGLFKGTGQNIPNAQLTAPSAGGFAAPPRGGFQPSLGGKDFSRLLQ